MTTLLKTVLSMSLTGSIAILIVLLVRLFLKRSPKIFSYILWSVVLFRLLCPVSVSSPLSLLGIAEKENDVQTSLADSAKTDTPFPAAGQEDIQPGYKPNLSVADHSQGHEIETEKTGKITGWEAAAAIWVLGIFFMCCYSGYSFVGAKRLLAGGIHKEGNIYEIDWEVSPFVLGVISPKICLPYWLDGQEREYVLLHERTHIKRGDHILKLFAFFALSLHWFNPLVWLAFYLAEKVYGNVV